MNHYIGLIVFFLFQLYILSANASENPIPEIIHDSDSKFHFADDVDAKIDFDTQKIVITANMLNKDKPKDEMLFGGNFSPTAAAYLKPLSNSKIKAFVQVRCVTVTCDQLAVVMGIRNKVGNPYAYQEQRFSLFRNN